jgi:hypothetical protein
LMAENANSAVHPLTCTSLNGSDGRTFCEITIKIRNEYRCNTASITHTTLKIFVAHMMIQITRV